MFCIRCGHIVSMYMEKIPLFSEIYLAFWGANSLCKFTFLCRYSMCAVATGDHVILVGGVGLQTTPDLIVINLPHQIWFGARVRRLFITREFFVRYL